MTWAPVQQKHAIERIRFDILFTESLPARVVEAARRAFDQSRSDIRFDEPTTQQTHKIVLSGGVPAPQLGKSSDGWQSGRKIASGLIAEAVTLNSNGFSYETSDYRDWATAYKRFEKVSYKTIERVASVVDFRSVSHEYIDRFVYQGFPDQAAPTGIFRADLLAPLKEEARSGRFLWHIHHGWFEEADGRSILVNQNFDAQDGQTPTGQEVRSIQILTKAEFRPRPEQFMVEDLAAIANQLHHVCNANFAASLTEDAKKMIGFDS